MWRHLSLPSLVLKPYLTCSFNLTIAAYSKTLTMATAKSIEECDVGIFCFISQTPGFRGILKQRYADFIVNEVDTDGNVVHLTCMDAPPQAVDEGETKVCDPMKKSYEAEIESFRSLVGDSDAERLGAFIIQATSGSEDSDSPIVLSPDSDKSHRTAVHNFFKENFKFLVTDTVEGPDVALKCVRVRLSSGAQSNNGRKTRKRKDRGDRPFDSRGSNNWPDHLGKFLRFHLYKENKDTQEALGLIGKMLGIQPRSFGFAGTKDKRSISTQRVTVFKQHASRLAALNDRLIGIKVGDFCYVNDELLLGQLLGNRFSVTLRGVVADSEDIVKASAESLGRNGFINYFGLQRFGSGSVPTHLIGAALLRGEWKTAIQRDVVRKAREYYKQSNDFEGTLKQLPRHLVAERAILQCLKKCPGNYLQALKAIPRTLRMMYVHSYQSYLWNHAASMRVKNYEAEQVVPGDLVYDEVDDTKKVTSINVDCDNDGSDDTFDCNHIDETSGVDFPERKSFHVKTVTTEDVAHGNYSIDDVILPLPGFRVIYPANDIANVYHDLAKKDGIKLTEHVHGVKEFSIMSMTGSYRRVFQKPMDFEWELIRYTVTNEPLTETDLDKIVKDKSMTVIKQGQNEEYEAKSPYYCSEQLIIPEDNLELSLDDNKVENVRQVELAQIKSPESQLALKLNFTLPASCYATMAVRELLKTSTSVAFHKTLNQ
ncbi:hypothetical protein K2173_017872 [Erythroxylum novogranatense]|uniref:TRUD domain-containing protein n=1 Tax=Erythroxylum novogranatense TaxID=1862640 RepID=A0AAV8T3A0_9ROSI|nr:hypothetical protein K2173_017872 [Erythroxylum novogranatense]